MEASSSSNGRASRGLNSAAAPIAQKILARYFEKKRAAAGEALAASGGAEPGAAAVAEVDVAGD